MEGHIGIEMAGDLEEQHSLGKELEQMQLRMGYSRTIAMEEVLREEREIGKAEVREGESSHCYCYYFEASCLSYFVLDYKYRLDGR